MKLAGTTMVYNGETYDYCYIEAIRSLLEFCDHVFVVNAGSTDSTAERLEQEFGNNSKVDIIHTLDSLVDKIEGVEGSSRLNYFSNIAIEAAQMMGYEYQFYLQGDEIVTPESYINIARAVSSGHEAFMVKRINLWGSPYTMLKVEGNRKPCSTEIVRLAKTSYKTYGDAESVGAPFETMFLNDITIIHYGFVRKREVMKAKITHIQEKVFETDHDKKLDSMEVFDPTAWFSVADLSPLPYDHPPCIREWVAERT